MAFTSGTATDHLDLLEKLRLWLIGTAGWTQKSYTEASKQATAQAINGGGNAYTVNDILTLVGGAFSTATQLKVTSVSGGVITGISLQTAGVYSVAPSNPVSCTGGTGNSATFNMTYSYIQTNTSQLFMEGPGNGGTSKVYVNIVTENNSGSNFYSWGVYGATAYTAAVSAGSQPNAGGPVYFNLTQTAVSYWFYGNSRHFRIEVKASTNYMSMYAGFMLPFALPSEYPQPMVIIASYPTMTTPGFANARNSMVVDPGADGAAKYLTRGTNIWRNVENQASNAAGNFPKTGQRAFIWPHKTGSGLGTTTTTGTADWNSGGINNIKRNFNNESPLLQAHIIDEVAGTVVMALDGCFSTTGFGRTTEQLLTLGGRTFRLFQRVGRANPGDFWASEEV